MAKLIFTFLLAATLIASVSDPKDQDPVLRHPASAMIDTAMNLLRNGDLVVRDTDEPISGLIKRFNKKDPSYSHAGLVRIENGYPFVYHMYMDRNDRSGSIHRDSLQRFCAPFSIHGFGIYRYQLTAGEIGQMNDLVKKWQRARLQFDQEFDLRTDDKMYCSEMIAKLITRSTNGRIGFQKTSLSLTEKLLADRYFGAARKNNRPEYIAIDNLYINPNCTRVCAFTYRH